MKLTNSKLGLILAWNLAIAAPALAQTVELTPDEAAGKIIFEETAGGVGCASCHKMDGSGDVGPMIVGQIAEVVQMKIDFSVNMAFINLTAEEVQQVAAYLAVLARK